MEKRIAALPETAALVRDVLIELDDPEFGVWTTVELARSRGTTSKETAELLRNEYGSHQAALEAFKVYERYKDARVGLVRESAARMEQQRLGFLEPKRQPAMTLESIIRHSALRAWELHIEPRIIWAKRPGRLTPGSEEEMQANARARIVVELRDKGATLEDIGRVFGGRRKESVYGLEQRGRRLRLKPGAPNPRPIDPKRVDDYRDALRAREKKQQRSEGGK